MGATFPGAPDEWADGLQAQINDSETFTRAAAGLSATFRFDVLPDETYEGPPVVLTVVVEDGVCVAAAGRDPEADYDFALRGPYTAWRALLRGEVDPVAAVTDGPFEFEGSTVRLLEHREAVAELVRSAQAVDTEFEY